jgi:hypothetical protein
MTTIQQENTTVTLQVENSDTKIITTAPAGATDFTDLLDVPSSYTGQSGKSVKVKSTEDGLEFGAGTAGQMLYTYVVAADGSGDYTTIEAALSALGSNSGTLFIRKGTYTPASPLRLYTGQSLIGAGRNDTVINGDTIGANAIIARHTSASAQIRNNVIKDLTIRRNVTTPVTGMHGIDTTNIQMLRVIDVTFSYLDYAIYGNGSNYYQEHRGVDTYGCNYNVYLQNYSNEIHFFGGRWNGTTDSKVYITNSDMVTFVGVSMEAVSVSVQLATGASYCNFIGCRLESGAGSTTFQVDSGAYYNVWVGGLFMSGGTTTITDNGTKTLIMRKGGFDTELYLPDGKFVNATGIKGTTSYTDLISGANGMRFYNRAATSGTRPMEFYTYNASNADTRRAYIENYVNNAYLVLTNNTGLKGIYGTTASRAMVTDANNAVATSATTDTELGYLSGVTSAIQTQINGKLANVVEDTTPQLGGTLDAQNNHLDKVKTITYYAEYDNGNSGTSKEINWNNGQNQKITMSGDCTLTFAAPAGPGTFKLRIIQDASTARVMTWPTMKWQGALVLPITSTLSAIDILTVYYDGTSYYAQLGMNFG